jgi:hypothetical protein
MDAKRPLGFAIAASKKLCQRSHVKTCTGGAKYFSSVLSWVRRYAVLQRLRSNSMSGALVAKVIEFQRKAHSKKFAQVRKRSVGKSRKKGKTVTPAIAQARAKEQVRVHRRLQVVASHGVGKRLGRYCRIRLS